MQVKLTNWFVLHIPHMIMGFMANWFAYFAGCQGAIMVVFAAIIIDLIFGLIAARVQGIGIKSDKLWRTAYKTVIVLLLILLLFAIDKELLKEGSAVYKKGALFIVGFEVWSILESAAKITNHRVFRFLQKYMQDEVKKISKIDLESKE